MSSARQALRFIEDVGFCFAFKSENSELPCLFHAASGQRNPVIPDHSHLDPRISFIWNLKDKLPAERKIYYGKLLKHRPTMVSLEYLAYFYVLAGRTGTKDEYLREFGRGNLSPLAKEILDALRDSSPETTRGLKLATGMHGRNDRQAFDRAMAELQSDMFVAKIAEEQAPFSFVWAPFSSCFPVEVRKARRISVETARREVLRRYFKNQLVVSVAGIHRLFGWKKQDIFRTLGLLQREGTIAPNAEVVNEPGHFYSLVQKN